MGQPAAANPALTHAECDAVRDWIKDGGSLLFITDHAPFGAAAECLAKRLGLELSKGATARPGARRGGEYEPGLHPVRITSWVTTRSLRTGTVPSALSPCPDLYRNPRSRALLGAFPILRLADTAIDHAFGDGKSELSAAGRAQGIAFTLGKGRVVVLGEAAELSAQVIGPDRKIGMNVPGLDNRQMALNIVHRLSGPCSSLREADQEGGLIARASPARHGLPKAIHDHHGQGARATRLGAGRDRKTTPRAVPRFLEASMARTTRGIATWFGWTIGVVSAAMAMAMAATPAVA